MNAKGLYLEEVEETTPPSKWEDYKVTFKTTAPASDLVLDAVAVEVKPEPQPAPKPALVGKFYEMGRDGGLVEVKSNFNNLPAGAVITWGGNYGSPAASYCILSRRESQWGVSYDCYNLDTPEANSHLNRVEARSIKSRDDESVWHSQHYFLEEETKSAAEVETFSKDYENRKAAREETEAAAKREGDRLEAEGRKLWKNLIGDCTAVIVAEKEHDETDLMTDYFGSRTIDTVILAASKHNRDLFPELRKAADRIEETRHLGTGKGKFTPRVEIAANFVDRGSCYYEGSRSHWHRELDQNEDGSEPVFTTREAAESFIASKGEPHPISFDGNVVSFKWNICEDKIEHREKYTGGHGYYLAYRYESGWHVEKHTFGQNGPTREYYIHLARRHDHLKPAK